MHPVRVWALPAAHPGWYSGLLLSSLCQLDCGSLRTGQQGTFFHVLQTSWLSKKLWRCPAGVMTLQLTSDSGRLPRHTEHRALRCRSSKSLARKTPHMWMHLITGALHIWQRMACFLHMGCGLLYKSCPGGLAALAPGLQPRAAIQCLDRHEH